MFVMPAPCTPHTARARANSSDLLGERQALGIDSRPAAVRQERRELSLGDHLPSFASTHEVDPLGPAERDIGRGRRRSRRDATEYGFVQPVIAVGGLRKLFSTLRCFSSTSR